jgi:hypothetical protein
MYIAMAKRPITLNRHADKPIIVALHGAGVEADADFWVNSIPAQPSSWVIIDSQKDTFFVFIFKYCY